MLYTICQRRTHLELECFILSRHQATRLNPHPHPQRQILLAAREDRGKLQQLVGTLHRHCLLVRDGPCRRLLALLGLRMCSLYAR